MKKSTKIILIILTVIASIVCLLCCLYIYQYIRGNRVNEQMLAYTAPVAVTDTRPDTEPQPTPTAPEAGEPAAEPDAESKAPAKPLPADAISVDFEALREVNSDIYAWIHIPDTNISYPVLQHPENDLFYNSRGVDKVYYAGGSIFSQRYNSKSFDEPMTVLYGHNYGLTIMFSQLNDYGDPEYFAAHPVVYIYTPEKLYEYHTFAAYPHSSEHLLLCYDFSDPEEFKGYFESLDGSFDANYRRELFPEPGDEVLTLSTCYRNNRMQRYLVQAVLAEEYDIEDK